jgi:hypothetical protein
VTGDKVTGDKVTGDKVTGDKVTGDKVTRDKVYGHQAGAKALESFLGRPAGSILAPSCFPLHYMCGFVQI